jgi:Family of unknown function (DUF6627)
MRSPQYFKTISRILILTMLHLFWLTSYGYAEMIPSESAVQSQTETQIDRQRIINLLNRKEVIEELEKYGISKVEAVARINSLTDKEVTTLVAEIDRLPAGGYFEAVAGAVMIVVYTLGVFFKGMVCIFTIFSDYCESKGGLSWVVEPLWWEDRRDPSMGHKVTREEGICYSRCYSSYYACLNPDQHGHVNESLCDEAVQKCLQRCEVEHARSIESISDSVPVEEDCDPGMESCT